jgi:predicted amidophosphoribosyltransferase
VSAAEVTARKAGRYIMDLLFPGRCLLCGEWLGPDAGPSLPLCAACAAALPAPADRTCSRCGIALVSETGACTRCRDADFAFESNTALFAYAGEARRLLNAYKFNGRLRLAGFFAGRAASSLPADDVPLVPVPSRPGRRTPDPVALLVRALAKDHGRIVLPLLARTGRVQQKSLDLRRRRENLLGRFRLAPGVWASAVPSEVVVVDDVFTTGATIDACARILKAAGCERVRSLTLVIEE